MNIEGDFNVGQRSWGDVYPDEKSELITRIFSVYEKVTQNGFLSQREALADLKVSLSEELESETFIPNRFVRKILEVASSQEEELFMSHFSPNSSFFRLSRSFEWNQLATLCKKGKNPETRPEDWEYRLIEFLNDLCSLRLNSLADLLESNALPTILREIQTEIDFSEEEDISPLTELAQTLLAEVGGDAENFDSWINELRGIFIHKTKTEYSQFIFLKNFLSLTPKAQLTQIKEAIQEWRENKSFPVDGFYRLWQMLENTSSPFDVFELISVQDLLFGAQAAWNRLQNDYEGNLHYKEFIRNFLVEFKRKYPGNQTIPQMLDAFTSDTSEEFFLKMEGVSEALSDDEKELVKLIEMQDVDALAENDVSRLLSCLENVFLMKIDALHDLLKSENFLFILNKLCADMTLSNSSVEGKIILLSSIVDLLQNMPRDELFNYKEVSSDFLESVQEVCRNSLENEDFSFFPDSYISYCLDVLDSGKENSSNRLRDWMEFRSHEVLNEENFYVLSNAIETLQKIDPEVISQISYEAIFSGIDSLLRTLEINQELDFYKLDILYKIVIFKLINDESIQISDFNLMEFQHVLASETKEEFLEKIYQLKNRQAIPEQKLLRKLVAIYQKMQQRDAFDPQALEMFDQMCLNLPSSEASASADFHSVCESFTMSEFEMELSKIQGFYELKDKLEWKSLCSIVEKRDQTPYFEKFFLLNLTCLFGVRALDELSNKQIFKNIFLKIQEKIKNASQEDITSFTAVGKLLLSLGNHENSPSFSKEKALLEKEMKSDFFQLLERKEIIKLLNSNFPALHLTKIEDLLYTENFLLVLNVFCSLMQRENLFKGNKMDWLSRIVKILQERGLKRDLKHKQVTLEFLLQIQRFCKTPIPRKHSYLEYFFQILKGNNPAADFLNSTQFWQSTVFNEKINEEQFYVYFIAIDNLKRTNPDCLISTELSSVIAKVKCIYKNMDFYEMRLLCEVISFQLERNANPQYRNSLEELQWILKSSTEREFKGRLSTSSYWFEKCTGTESKWDQLSFFLEFKSFDSDYERQALSLIKGVYPALTPQCDSLLKFCEKKQFEEFLTFAYGSKNDQAIQAVQKISQVLLDLKKQRLLNLETVTSTSLIKEASRITTTAEFEKSFYLKHVLQKESLASCINNAKSESLFHLIAEFGTEILKEKREELNKALFDQISGFPEKGYDPEKMHLICNILRFLPQGPLVKEVAGICSSVSEFEFLTRMYTSPLFDRIFPKVTPFERLRKLAQSTIHNTETLLTCFRGISDSERSFILREIRMVLDVQESADQLGPISLEYAKTLDQFRNLETILTSEIDRIDLVENLDLKLLSEILYRIPQKLSKLNASKNPMIKEPHLWGRPELLQVLCNLMLRDPNRMIYSKKEVDRFLRIRETLLSYKPITERDDLFLSGLNARN